MHSKIIQLETYPVSDGDRISPSTFYDEHRFMNTIADYVDADGDRQGTLETLRGIFRSVGNEHLEFFSDETGEGVIFKDGFTRAYLEQCFKVFQYELRQLVAKTDVNAFCDSKLDLALYQLNEAYDNEYGYYIKNEEEGLLSIIGFVRRLRPNIRYYFGATVDYHF